MDLMNKSDDFDHTTVCNTIKHDMTRAFDRPMGVFGLLT
jgi:hypothetical protein